MPRVRLPDDDEIREAIEQVNADPRVIVNEDGSKTLRLLESIKVDGKELDSVTFRMPTGRDWMAMDKGDGPIEQGFRFAASLSGIPLNVILKLQGDEPVFWSTVASTVGKGSKTGGTC